MKFIKVIFLLFLIGYIFPLHLVGLRVEFIEDNNSETSGNGKFLTDIDSNLNYIDYPNIYRCTPDYNPETGVGELVIDLPPHDKTYFKLQLEAVKNYYKATSDKDFTVGMIDDHIDDEIVYQLYHTMDYYAKSDQKIGLLFADALEKAYNSGDLDNYLNWYNSSLSVQNDILFVVFHAGLGQEASQSFDPTIYDIRSAYIDSNMLVDVKGGSYWINDNNINNGLVMPETLNWIFYDVIEEVISIDFTDKDDLDNALCVYQIGMTGLFAHLLGYHFNFPIMSNVDNGRYGIGKFGLMDEGWFNSSGIIPPKVNPWTRSNNKINGWVNRINFTGDVFKNLESQIIISNTEEDIYQFDIADKEYFLLENRNNSISIPGNKINDIDDVYDNKSIDCIIDYYRDYPSYCPLDESLQNDNLEYSDEQDEFKHLFDIIKKYGVFYNDFVSQNSLSDNDIFQIHEVYNVITRVNDYDYGLPGSGILIWHVKEPSVEDYLSGINHDYSNRAVVLEEADGVQHIGSPNYEWFVDYTKGREFDFWYKGNTQYEHVHYPNCKEGGVGYSECISSKGCFWDNNRCDFQNENEFLAKQSLFDYVSIPNTRTNDQLNSYLSFEILDIPKNEMKVNVLYDYSDIYTIEYLDDDIYAIGNSPDENCIFYWNDSSNRDVNHPIMKVCLDDDNTIKEFVTLEQSDFHAATIPNELSTINSRVLVYDKKYFLVENSNYYIVDNEIVSFDESIVYPNGYYSSLNQIEEIIDALSLGDIDEDGYDEKLLIDDNNTLHCYNSNDTFCPGFPVYGNFKGIPLIVNILNNQGPEIIVKNGDFISIISSMGENILNISSYDNYSDLQIIPNWGNNNTACLVNGNRLFIFSEFNEENSYWYNYRSTSYNYPEVIIPGPRDESDNINNTGIDLNRSYAYPNPIENGYTKFRFFVHSSNQVTIKIYDTLGIFINKLESSNLVQNEYNEIYWDASNVESGLYFAELQSDLKESKLIKLAVIK